MSFGEVFGLVAGLFTTSSLVPQVIRVFKLRSAHEISLLFNILFLVGGLLWLFYGISYRLFPVIMWNILGVVLTSALFIAKLKYGKTVHRDEAGDLIGSGVQGKK